MKKKELQRQLGIANRTVLEQLTNQAKLIEDWDAMEQHYDSHMAIAEREIKRLHTIITYLETKDK